MGPLVLPEGPFLCELHNLEPWPAGRYPKRKEADDISGSRGVVSAVISIALTSLLYIWVIRRTGTCQKAGAANLFGFVCTVISTVSLLSLIWVAPPAVGLMAMTGFLVWSLANLTWLALTFTPSARVFFARVR